MLGIGEIDRVDSHRYSTSEDIATFVTLKPIKKTKLVGSCGASNDVVAVELRELA